MKEKGFTLIELLAVIVILAIIALIATPIVLNIIEDSKKSAFVQTGNGIVDAAEYYYMNEMSDGVKPTENKVFTFDGSTTGIEGLEFDGEIPKEGTLTVNTEGKVQLVAHNNQYCLTKVYDETEVTIKDYDGKCSLPVCTLVNDADNDGKITEGDKYECEVKEGTKYNFYVLSQNSDGTTNLIMDRNIYYDSEIDTSSAADSTNTGFVAWISNLDYGCDGNYCASVDKGPVTAMNYLYNATKDWANIPDIIMDYTDEGGRYGTIKTENSLTKITKKDGTTVTVLTDQEGYANLKARMLYYSEAKSYESDSKYAYLYDNLKLICLDDNNNVVSCDVATKKIGVQSEGITHIDGIECYWTLPSAQEFPTVMNSSGIPAVGVSIDNDSVSGVRPVITLQI